MGRDAPVQSPARRRALVAYVRRLKAELHLQAWHVRIVWEYPNTDDGAGGDVQAETEPMGARWLAELRLGEGFWRLDRAGVRRVLTHELLHLHHADLFRLVDADEAEPILRQGLGAVAFGMFSGNVKRELELMVDQLTAIVEPAMPLPPAWPK